MTKEKYLQIELFMQEHMNDTVHDKLHVYRVLNYALQIADTYSKCDLDVIITAALLHDIGRVEELRDSSVCHATVGSEKAYTFLRENNYESDFCNAVKNCILKHRHKSNLQCETIEEKIVFDADKIDLIGNVGVARAILFGGQIDEPLYLLDEKGMPTMGMPSEEPSLFREYHRKLKFLINKLHTQAAKEIARSQQETMNDYFDKLIEEINNNHKKGFSILKDYLQ